MADAGIDVSAICRLREEPVPTWRFESTALGVRVPFGVQWDDEGDPGEGEHPGWRVEVGVSDDRNDDEPSWQFEGYYWDSPENLTKVLELVAKITKEASPEDSTA